MDVRDKARNDLLDLEAVLLGALEAADASDAIVAVHVAMALDRIDQLLG